MGDDLNDVMKQWQEEDRAARLAIAKLIAVYAIALTGVGACLAAGGAIALRLLGVI